MSIRVGASTPHAVLRSGPPKAPIIGIASPWAPITGIAPPSLPAPATGAPQNVPNTHSQPVACPR